MMNPEMNTETDSQDPEMGQDAVGIDSIISRVNDYIAHPEQVTPETLVEMRDELLDLKAYLDNEETPTGEEEQVHHGGAPTEGPGLSILIGNVKRRNK